MTLNKENPMHDVALDDQDRSDRFTWHDGDVIWTALPNGRGSIIEAGQRVRFGEKQGVVEHLTDERQAVIVTDDGQSFTTALDELEPAE